MTLDAHNATVRVPRLPVQPERTHELLMHLARVGAMSTEQLFSSNDSETVPVHFLTHETHDDSSKVRLAR